MVSPNRMTLAFNEDTPRRIKEVSAKLGISQARLIACLVAMPDDQIKAAIEANHDRIFPKTTEAKENRKAALALVKKMTPEELATILAAAKQSA